MNGGSATLTKLLVLGLGSGLPAWAGWTLGRPSGIMSGYWLAVVSFAVGWYFSRKLVRDFLD